MTWTIEERLQGYSCENSTEHAVYGPSLVSDDKARKNSLDIHEAAEYINMLESAMKQMIKGWDTYNGRTEMFFQVRDPGEYAEESMDRGRELLSTDVWTRIRARKQLEKESE